MTTPTRTLARPGYTSTAKETMTTTAPEFTALRPSLYPPAPPGGIWVRYTSATPDTEDGPQTREDEHVERPGQAMRWIRRRVVALLRMMDRPDREQAEAWLRDVDGLAVIVNQLSRSQPFEAEWTVAATGARVRMSATPVRALPVDDERRRAVAFLPPAP